MCPLTVISCKMAWRGVFALLLFSVTFVKSSIFDLFKDFDNSPVNDTYLEKLHCIYSRYMLYYFELNAIVFENDLGKNIDYNSDSHKAVAATLEVIHSYDEQLRSQGNIVLAMLDELRVIKRNSNPPDDLMQVNLYLNNLTGSTIMCIEKIGANNNNSSKIHPSNYINGYKFFYKKMTEALTTFIRNGKCYYEEKYIVRDEYKQLEVEEINQLLADKWPLDANDSKYVLSILKKNKTQLETIFKSTFERETYNDFQPEHLLFMPLVQLDKAYSSLVSSNKGSVNLPGNDKWISDQSFLVSNVVTTYMFDGANARIVDLLIRVQAIFHQNNVISFQQHVIAAALSPMLICLGEYLNILIILYPSVTKSEGDVLLMYSKYKDKMRGIGLNLYYHLYSLMNLNIFPTSVKQYLQILSDYTLGVLQGVNKPYPQYIFSVMDRISEHITKLMVLYNIRFSLKINTEKLDLKKDDDVNLILEYFEDKKNQIGLYVANMERYKYAFSRGLNIYDHKDMFRLKPYPILDTKDLGYCVLDNNIDKPPRIQLINS